MNEQPACSFSASMNDLKKVRVVCVIRNLPLQCTWYWGALSWEEAEHVLDSRPAGSFLLRDSASDRYIFTLSVRLVDRCVHARLPQHAGKFCLGGPNSLLKSESLVAFVEETVRRSADERLNFLMHRKGEQADASAVCLSRPVGRHELLPSLKYLCRVVVRHALTSDAQRLPLPAALVEYIGIPDRVIAIGISPEYCTACSAREEGYGGWGLAGMIVRGVRRYASTIFALSSGAPPSAIAVIRISGEKSLDCLRALTNRPEAFTPRMLTYCRLYDGTRLLDRSMVVYLPGPRTFTGEDSVELYVHGGRAVIESVSTALAAMQDVRMARAGEFTRRAFYNGKMHLSQVEALADLIAAETSTQQELALKQDEIPRLFMPIRAKLISLIASMEAAIDFADEVDDDVVKSGQLDTVIEQLQTMQRRSRRGSLIRDGIRVAIVGRTNVGKSSLLNTLVERDAAIVSAIAGTTRDAIEVRMMLKGIPVIVCDTAGIRQTNDPLETEGIRRTMTRASEADILIAVIDGSEETGEGVDEELATLLNVEIISGKAGNRPVLVVLNKSDLDIRRRVTTERCVVHTSCKSRAGVETVIAELETNIEQVIGESSTSNEGFTLSRQRHRMLLDEAIERLCEAREASGVDAAIAVMRVRQAATAIGQLAGAVVNEEILDEIFGQFCIGK